MSAPLPPSRRSLALAADLKYFSGSELVFRHHFNPQLIYTEGVRFLATEAEAYWLLDEIALLLRSERVREAMQADDRLRCMQFWRLEVSADHSAVLSMRADVDVPTAVVRNIPFTDFPMPTTELWLADNGQGWTLYLPSEH